MIRVLQMIGSLSMGGSQTLVMELYRKIDREKIQFDFIVDHSNDLFFAEEIKKLGGKIYFMPTFRGSNIYEVRKAWDDFFKKNTQYKILHSHVRSYASLFISIAKKYGVKTIIHSHSTSNGTGIKSFIKSILQHPLRYQADYFIGCSKEAGQWLFGNKVIKGDKYHTLQNGIDLSKFIFNNTIRNKVRKEFGLSDEVVFGHVGRLHEAKNHNFLLAIYKELREYIPNSKLLIVGDGELKEQIKYRIAELGIEEAVIMTGLRKDIPDLLMCMDCFLFPSKWEGLPIGVVEAQALGLQCFISDNVTKEVAITSNAHYLSIDLGEETWVKKIINTKIQRNYEYENIVEAGFDISVSCEWLEELYLKLS